MLGDLGKLSVLFGYHELNFWTQYKTQDCLSIIYMFWIWFGFPLLHCYADPLLTIKAACRELETSYLSSAVERLLNQEKLLLERYWIKTIRLYRFVVTLMVRTSLFIGRRRPQAEKVLMRLREQSENSRPPHIPPEAI